MLAWVPPVREDWNLGSGGHGRILFERGLRISRGKLGDDHPEVAHILGNLGSLELEVGRPRQARAQYLEALEVYQEVPGAEHPNTVRIGEAASLIGGGQNNAIALF